MKWFWYSLIGLCLLICSCKTQKSARLINDVSKENIQTELFKFEALTDTSRLHKIEIDKSKLKIIETITTKKYDKDTGAITEETTTEREITQDSDKVSTEEENQSVTNCNQLEVDYSADVSKKIDSEVKEESRSDSGFFWKQFGKSLGIIMGFALIFGLLGRYLLEKFRVS